MSIYINGSLGVGFTSNYTSLYARKVPQKGSYLYYQGTGGIRFTSQHGLTIDLGIGITPYKHQIASDNLPFFLKSRDVSARTDYLHASLRVGQTLNYRNRVAITPFVGFKALMNANHENFTIPKTYIDASRYHEGNLLSANYYMEDGNIAQYSYALQLGVASSKQLTDGLSVNIGLCFDLGLRNLNTTYFYGKKRYDGYGEVYRLVSLSKGDAISGELGFVYDLTKPGLQKKSKRTPKGG